MPVKYICDRCDRNAVSHVTLEVTTPAGTHVRTEKLLLCQQHISAFNEAVAFKRESKMKETPHG
jgi:hypothetical protein